MYAHLMILSISFIITVIMTPFARRIALRTNIVDQPDNNLKIHKIAIPYLGGIAIFTGIISSLFFAHLHFSFQANLSLAVGAGMLFIMILGLLDDLFEIKQNYKFIIQILIAILFALFGFRINTVPLAYITIPLSVFYIVGACNALNLLDGLDGLACGNSAISAVFFLILFWAKQDNFGLVLAISLLGTCFAFLIFNFNPAKIFMGDAGSMLLGFVLAVLMIRYSSKPYDAIDFISPILVCGVPIFDTSLTYLRRYLNSRPIFPGDRSHFYDQLIDRGFTIKQTVIISYVLGGIFGSIAVIINFLPLVTSLLIVLGLLSILLIVVQSMNMLKVLD